MIKKSALALFTTLLFLNIITSYSQVLEGDFDEDKIVDHSYEDKIKHTQDIVKHAIENVVNEAHFETIDKKHDDSKVINNGTNKEKIEENTGRYRNVKNAAKEKYNQVKSEYENIKEKIGEKSNEYYQKIKEKLNDKEFTFYSFEIITIVVLFLISSILLWYSRKKNYKMNQIKKLNLDNNNLNLNY